MGIPRNRKMAQKWFGLALFLSQYIEHYSRRTKGLQALMKLPHKTYSDLDIKRLGVKEEMGGIVKELVGGKVLKIADYNKRFTVKCDGSLHGLGATLMQEGDDGKLYPVRYASKSVSKTKRERTQPQLSIRGNGIFICTAQVSTLSTR